MTAPICAISVVWVKKTKQKKKQQQKKKKKKKKQIPTYRPIFSRHVTVNTTFFCLINLLYRLWSKNIFYLITRITYTTLSKSAFKVEKTKRIGNVKKKKDLKHKILQNSIEKIESTAVLSRLRYL